MLGVPSDDHDAFARWSDAVFASPDTVDPDALAGIISELMEMWQYFDKMLAQRKTTPGEDLLTALIQSEIDGECLSDLNMVMLCATLLAAGVESAKNLISGAALALAQHPEQRRILVEEPSLIRTGVEEFLRWVSPVRNVGRRAKEATQIRGQIIEPDDYVVMLYESANRDEEIWSSPSIFDVTRRPDPAQLAFGWGEHICLGAGLARLEIRIVFEELLSRYPHYEVVGCPQRIPSAMSNGLTTLPVRLMPGNGAS